MERPRVADLGCGDGRLTAALRIRLGARYVLGVDSSTSMLEQASAHAGPDIEFVPGDLGRWRAEDYDIVLSNAALQWVDDHEAVLTRWTDSLAPSGQLAVQVPANADHPSHVVSRELAAEWLGDDAPSDPVEQHVHPPDWYAELLYRLGFVRRHVRLQVYGHLLESPADVVEWVKGTSLTRFRAVLDPGHYEAFVDEYRRRLLAVIGDRRPYFYAFKRILLWGRRPDPAG